MICALLPSVTQLRTRCAGGLCALAAALAAAGAGAGPQAWARELGEPEPAAVQSKPAAARTQTPGQSEASPAQPRTLVIAVTDDLEAVTDDMGIADTFEALQKALPSYTIYKSSAVTADVRTWIAQNKPDFLIAATGSVPVFTEGAASAYRLVTRKSPQTQIASQSIGSTVVALKNRTDINEIADLKGKTVAATLPDSIAGWLALAGEVHDLGYDPETFFERVFFLDTLFPNLTAALWGKSADAVVMPACFLETLERQGLADVTDLKVVGKKEGSALRCQHSTALYPDVSFYGFGWTSEESARDVTIALLSMSAAAGAPEWRSNVDASRLDALFRKLSVGPYAYDAGFSFSRFYERYKTVIFMAAAVLLALIAHAAILQHLVKRRTRQLSEALENARKMEAAARENRARLGTLERRNIVNQMSGMIAHEIKSPVGAVLNFKAILDFVLPQQVRAQQAVDTALSGIESEAVKIAGIVDRVRSYAKSQKSAQRPCELVEIARKAIESVRAASSGDARIRTRFPDKPCTVTGDPLELELLIVNLVKNAWQAQSDRARPEIDVAVDMLALRPQDEQGDEKESPPQGEFSELGRLAGRAMRPKAEVVLTVNNPGKVLSEEEFARLAQIAESVKPEGLGMGLSIVRGICDSHAARLVFSRRPAGGVRVKVIFSVF